MKTKIKLRVGSTIYRPTSKGYEKVYIQTVYEKSGLMVYQMCASREVISGTVKLDEVYASWLTSMEYKAWKQEHGK